MPTRINGHQHIMLTKNLARWDNRDVESDGKLTEIIRRMSHGRLTVARRVVTRELVKQFTGATTPRSGTRAAMPEYITGKQLRLIGANETIITGAIEVALLDTGELTLGTALYGGKTYLQFNQRGPWKQATSDEITCLRELMRNQPELTDYGTGYKYWNYQASEELGSITGGTFAKGRTIPPGPGSDDYALLECMDSTMGVTEATIEHSGAPRNTPIDLARPTRDVTINNVQVPLELLEFIARTAVNSRPGGSARTDPYKVRKEREAIQDIINGTQLTPEEKKTLIKAVLNVNTIAALAHLHDRNNLLIGNRDAITSLSLVDIVEQHIDPATDEITTERVPAQRHLEMCGEPYRRISIETELQYDGIHVTGKVEDYATLTCTRTS